MNALAVADGSEPAVLLGAFQELCEAAAFRWEKYQVELHDAVDELQSWAVERGLVAKIGQDRVQEIIAEPFAWARAEPDEFFGTPFVWGAAEAIKANPQKSDRAIAEEIGVGKDTVRRAQRWPPRCNLKNRLAGFPETLQSSARPNEIAAQSE